MGKINLILQNGEIFQGESFGASGEITGEVVFTTAMTGYLETLTDPSYYGQIVVQTFPLIGNYGVIPEDFESKKIHLKGYIVRDLCSEPSNFRSQGRLDDLLKEQGVVGIKGIDTRQLTRIVREYGVMNGIITTKSSLDEKAFEDLKNYVIKNAVSSVTEKNIEVFQDENSIRTVVLIDYGAKQNIQRELLKRGCKVIVVPSTITAKEVLAYKPNGIMLSNGPGDPSENKEAIAVIKDLFKSGIPMFGICLGHQLTALSQGAKTVKLKYGHRGANQPVKDMQTGRVYITSQNHGYAVVSDSLPKNATARYINANDNTCEGVDYASSKVFTVQFHPEACGGPLDTRFLFDRFIKNMEENK